MLTPTFWSLLNSTKRAVAGWGDRRWRGLGDGGGGVFHECQRSPSHADATERKSWRQPQQTAEGGTSCFFVEQTCSHCCGVVALDGLPQHLQLVPQTGYSSLPLLFERPCFKVLLVSVSSAKQISVTSFMNLAEWCSRRRYSHLSS